MNQKGFRNNLNLVWILFYIVTFSGIYSQATTESKSYLLLYQVKTATADIKIIKAAIPTPIPAAHASVHPGTSFGTYLSAVSLAATEQ